MSPKFLSGGSCVSEDGRQPSSNGGYYACEDGRHPNSSGDCDCPSNYYDTLADPIVCEECPTECSECSSNTICLSCTIGNYLSGNSCISCSESCKRCDGNSTCLECQEPFELINGTCETSPQDQLDEDLLPEGVYISSTASNLMGLGVITSLGLSVLSMQPSAFWSFLNISILIYYSPLQNVDAPEAYISFTSAFNSDLFGIIPNLGELIGVEGEKGTLSLIHI